MLCSIILTYRRARENKICYSVFFPAYANRNGKQQDDNQGKLNLL